MSDSTPEVSNSSSSVSSFVVSFIINFLILAAFVGAFLLLRPIQQRIYQPRVNIDTVPANQRPKPLKSGIVGWFKDLVTRPEADILQDAGLDGYFFLRYLRLIFTISVVGILIVCPILLPVNATGGNNQSGFNILSFENVKNSNRYYAHALVSWVFFGYIIFTLYRELVYYVGVRSAVLTSPAYSTLVSSRTILIATVPKEYLTVEALTSVFDGVKYVWINRNVKELSDKVEEREKLASKMEGAETKLLNLAVKNRLKSEKKRAKGVQVSLIEGDDITLYVPDKKRPTHKLKPIIGKKVDTIEYGREHIEELNKEIYELRGDLTQFPELNSVFVCFHTQEQAETAVQVLMHHRALNMAPRFIGIRPDEIIWSNLRLLWWERIVKAATTTAIIAVMVIFWAIPVAFVGSISNIKSLTEKLPWLDFLNSIPDWIYGVVSGFLPTILLAVVMMLPPIILRILAKVAGMPSQTLVEYYVQNAFFAFQVIQVFLVTTIASGAAAVVQDIINDPSSAMSLLADNLPKASNFFISYFLLQGFTIAGGALLQLVALILFHVLGTILDNTPRKKWSRWNLLGITGWGTVFPIYSTLAVISITYAIISPLMLFFSAICFGVVYVAYLHNLLFVMGTSEGRGIFYPRAIYQTFTGLYIAQVCLLGLFVVAKAWGPLVLMVVILVVTVLVQINLQSAFAPLMHNLPRDLLRKKSASAALPGTPPQPFGRQAQTSSVQYDAAEIQGALEHQGSHEKPQHTRDESLSSGGPMPVTSESQLGQGPSSSRYRPTKESLIRYFKPHIFLKPEIIQKEFLTQRFFEAPPPLPSDVESGAYANPAITADNPVVWIPRDPWGLSEIEVRKMRAHDVNAYDEGTWFDIDEKQKAQIKWGELDDVPIWSPPPPY